MEQVYTLPIAANFRFPSNKHLMAWRILEASALLVILALAAYLRLVNLADNPGWYADEGTHVDIAQNLLHGRTQYLAINQSTLLFARLPLFEYLLAGFMGIFGEGILTLRMLTALLGVISVGLLYLVTRYIQPDDRILSSLAALVLAIYPSAVLYSRFGFSYNLLTPLILFAFLGLVQYWHSDSRRWLALAAAAIGIGLISDLMIGTLIIVVVIVVIVRQPRDLIWSLPLIAFPFGFYTLVMLLTVPDAFLFDLGHTLFRLNTLSLTEQIGNIPHNYTILLAQGFWFPAGIIGLFLMHPTRLRAISLLFLFVPIIILGRTVALYHLSFYYVIPLLPFVALGIAALARYSTAYIIQGLVDLLPRHRWQQRVAGISGVLLVLLLVGSPLLSTLIWSLGNVKDQFPTSIDPFLLDADTARETVAYVNNHTTPSDVVIASAGIAWALNARAADFQMSVVSEGKSVIHMPSDIPADRFVFDPSFTRARFVIVDNIWHNWGAVHLPAVAEMVHDLQSWPLVFEAGSFQVYRNPKR